MGYSIMTPFESIEKRDAMMEFLNKNYKKLDEIMDNYKDYTRGPVFETSYGGDVMSPKIGFDYGSGCDLERDYVIRICSWMALMSGAQKEFQVNGEKMRLPYLNYDGSEEWALIVSKEQSVDAIAVDKYGFRPIETPIISNKFFARMLKKKLDKELRRTEASKLVKGELIRLTKLWKGEV